VLSDDQVSIRTVKIALVTQLKILSGEKYQLSCRDRLIIDQMRKKLEFKI